jgi:hypothetical protein
MAIYKAFDTSERATYKPVPRDADRAPQGARKKACALLFDNVVVQEGMRGRRSRSSKERRDLKPNACLFRRADLRPLLGFVRKNRARENGQDRSCETVTRLN